ncbi:MAG: CBS domain-containing protein [Methermicoccaceae archaeon]
MGLSKVRLAEIMVEPYTIDKNEHLSTALDIIDKQKTRRLVVTNDGALYGVLTLRGLMKTLGEKRKATVPPSSLHVSACVSKNFETVEPDTSVKRAKELLCSGMEMLVCMEGENVVGYVSPRQVLEAYQQYDKIAGKVEDAMIAPYPVSPKDRLVHARRIMIDNDVGRLPVLEGGELVGILTERDVANAMRTFKELVPTHQQENRIRLMLVEDAMSRAVVSFKEDEPLDEVSKVLLERRFGGAPVMNSKDELVGMLNRRTILNVL